MRAGCYRRSIQDLALTAIEARQVPARQSGPVDAVQVHITTARSISWQRRLIYLCQCGVRRVGARDDPHDVTGIADRGAPHGTVGGTDCNGIRVDDYTLVLPRIDRLIGLDVIVASAVAVGVEDERCPALRLSLVTSLLERFAVEPTDDARTDNARARPQRLVCVHREVEVVS